MKKFAKWLYCLLIALVYITTTSCSDTKDEPVYPELSETAWELISYTEISPTNSSTNAGEGNEYVDNEPDPELLVFHKDGKAEIWTSEVDFDYPIYYNYSVSGDKLTTILTDWYDDLEPDDIDDPAEDDDNIVNADWKMYGNVGEKKLQITAKDSEGYTRILVYKMQPYAEVKDWVNIHKSEWGQYEK